MSSQWLKVVEHRLGSALTVASVDQLALPEFEALLGDVISFHNTTVTLPDRSASQLRPRIDGDGSWRAATGSRTAAPQPLRAMIKSLLLLADSVALQDPLLEAWLLVSDETNRLALLRRRLRDVARITELLRADVVIVYSPSPSLISMNSGYSITSPDKLGEIRRVGEQELTPDQRQAFRNPGLQFDWDAAWVSHALENGIDASFAENLALVEAGTSQQLFFCGNLQLVERVKGLLWEQRVRRYYKGLCDPGPMAPETSDLFCSMLRLLRQAITARDEVNTNDYYFLLTNPLLHADRIKLQDIVALRRDSNEFAEWRDLIRQSLAYAYHADYKYVDEHAEFIREAQAKIDTLTSQLASGRRGQLLSHALDVGEALSVGGVIGLAQYFLQADLMQSLVAAPVAAVGTIVWRVIKTFCLEESNAVQAHYVAFGR